jgi:SAM-dependent methyltransferase
MELVKNPLFARYFIRCGGRNEERGGRELRLELLHGLSGRVIEVGAGTGLNFPHYPAQVREVVAVEPEPYLRSEAVTAAAAAPVPVRVVDGTAAELPAADGEFDAAVVSGVLCSVADVPAAPRLPRVSSVPPAGRSRPAAGNQASNSERCRAPRGRHDTRGPPGGHRRAGTRVRCRRGARRSWSRGRPASG